MNAFAQWLSTTPPSVFIQVHQGWTIRTLQSIHIIAIGVAVGSVLMMTLRVLGWAGMDQTVSQVERRFGPWLLGALCVLATTGVLMVIGEPVRELVSFSFWAKMSLLAIVVAIAAVFHISVRRYAAVWNGPLAQASSVKLVAVGSSVLWLCVIVLGRLIAYDQVWGSLSPVAPH